MDRFHVGKKIEQLSVANIKTSKNFYKNLFKKCGPKIKIMRNEKISTHKR